MSDYVFYPVTGDGLTPATAYTWKAGTINFDIAADWAAVASFTTLTIGGSVTTGTVPGGGANVGLIAGAIDPGAFMLYQGNPSKGDPYINSSNYPVDVLLNSGSVALGNLLLAGFNQYATVFGPGAPAQFPTLDVEGAALTVGGNILDTGTVTFPPIVIPFVGAISSATATGGGTIDLGQGASIDVAGSVAAGITFNFNDGSGNVLEIGGDSKATPTGFAGTITGFVPGDTILLPDVPDIVAGVTTTANFDVTTGVLSITVGDPVTIDLNVPGFAASSGPVAVTPSGGGIEFATCYLAGTRIATPDGETAIEALRSGDLVLTADGNHREVRWIGERRLDTGCHPDPALVQPIRIRRGAVAENLPRRDLLVSPDHALFIDGLLVPARLLQNGATIRRETAFSVVHYFHVELDAHDLMLAEGMPAESYLDTGNRGTFENADLPLVLHPDLATDDAQRRRESESCATFAADADRVQPIWHRLMERALMLGYEVPAPLTTNDPDLRIRRSGRDVRPVFTRNGRYVFVLPPGSGEVRLLSRAAAPCDATPWIEDRRRLGVMVERINLRQGADVRTLLPDHPMFEDGWWAVEHDATGRSRCGQPRRWTNGDAVLPVPTGASIVEIDVAGTVAYPVETVPSQVRRSA